VTDGPSATIVIVTKDRRETLRGALVSALAQEGGPEVLVVDDGSTDGTAEMVRQEFPEARLQRHEVGAGLVVRRNQATALARGDIVVSLDDDAVLTTPRIVAQTLEDFDHPRIAAVAIPYVDVNRDPAEHQRAPQPTGRWIGPTFRGTAYAVRRDVFLAMGGFRQVVFQQGEELDFTLRLLEAGAVVRLGRADVIHHLESPRRDLARMALYGRRNEILLCMTRYPSPWHIAASVGYAAKGIPHGWRLGLLRPTIRGILDGVAVSWRLRDERRPVARRTLRLERRLRRSGGLELGVIASQLPPLGCVSPTGDPRGTRPGMLDEVVE
jgi:glycosyltransferase involved in cell wall biosynthesis